MQPQADPFIAPFCAEQISILYQDDALLLIHKPSGLLSLSGKHPANLDSVHYRLVQDFPTATLTHRLDFGTSGIMLVALNKAVNGHITKQFQARSIYKTYTALLAGHMAEDEGILDYPIAKDIDHFPLQKICYEVGKPAQSQYRVLARLDNPAVTRMLFMPITGRTHQLRIHSSACGFPILGCDLYATDAAFHMASRLMLHATELHFDHPITGKRVEGNSPCPF